MRNEGAVTLTDCRLGTGSLATGGDPKYPNGKITLGM